MLEEEDVKNLKTAVKDNGAQLKHDVVIVKSKRRIPKGYRIHPKHLTKRNGIVVWENLSLLLPCAMNFEPSTDG